MVYLKIAGSNDIIKLEGKAEFVLGRSDESSQVYPDIDLSPYGAEDEGVSRHHAKLILLGNKLNYIMDMSSTNGTSLNGEPLEPLQHWPISNGDRLELGNLKLTFHEE